MQNPVVEVETTISAAPDRVWRAMTDGAMFPGTEVETDWQVGSPITLKGEWEGRPFKDYGEVQTVERGKLLMFSHWSKTPERPENYHVVRYALTPEGGKTRVKISQFNEGPKPEVDAATKAEFKKTWTIMLEALKTSAEGKAN